MSVETFEFKNCSRWALACKLFGVLWSRKMAVATQSDPVSVEVSHSITEVREPVRNS